MSTTPESSPPKSGKYLYAIAAQESDRAYDVAGIDGLPVQSLSNGRVAAVCSDCTRQKLGRNAPIWRPTRKCSSG